MKNTITLAEAKESVKNVSFGELPTGWVIDFNKVAKAYKSYFNRTNSHDTAVYFIAFYIHRFRVMSFNVIEA